MIPSCCCDVSSFSSETLLQAYPCPPAPLTSANRFPVFASLILLPSVSFCGPSVFRFLLAHILRICLLCPYRLYFCWFGIVFEPIVFWLRWYRPISCANLWVRPTIWYHPLGLRRVSVVIFQHHSFLFSSWPWRFAQNWFLRDYPFDRTCQSPALKYLPKLIPLW